ncbi:MAG: right-handed parallel beta-helix repeat-containing protein [Candidatus Eisenbacteria bacterium]
MNPTRSLGVVALALLLSSTVCGAATIRVPEDHGTIGEAAGVAVLGDTIVVASGTYSEHGIALRSGVCLMGETGDAADVSIDAFSQGRILSIDDSAGSGETVLTGLTFEGGLSITGGALLGCGTMRMIDVVFHGNVADQGGAIACAAGSILELEHCSFITNWGWIDGGAIFAEGLHLRASACDFINNHAGQSSAEPGRGGGICMLGGESQCLLADVAFFCNQINLSVGLCGWGGGIYVESSDVVVTGCTFWDNTAAYGSDVYAESGLIENTIMAFSDGVFLSWYGSAPQLTCCNLFPGGWYGDIADQLGINGNISEWPDFCESLAEPPWALDYDSPCAPANSGGCGLIGAADVGCYNISVTTPTSWGALKCLYK